MRIVAAIRELHAGRHQGRDADPEAVAGGRRSRPRRCSRRRAAGSASARSGRCRSPSGCTRAIETGEGQVGLITYMRTDSTAIAGVAMGEAREVIGERYGEPNTRCPRAASTRRSRRAPRRPTSRSVRRASGATRTRWPARSSPTKLRLYRLIWQRALASQMAPKELETTTIELADGRYELRASATKVLFDGFARRLHRGSRRRRDRRRRGDRTPARARPTATGRRVERRHADPALHRAAAALHRGDADQGARGARHRPPVDLCGDDLDDHRPRLRPGRGAPAPPGAGRRDRDRPPGRALRRLRRRRVHGPDGGGARRGRQRRARVGPAPARASTARCKTASTRRATRSSAGTRATDEVCSEGHPMVIRLGRNGRFLACSLYPEHKETRPVPGDEPPPQEGTGEVCPECGEGTLVSKNGRFGPFVGCSRYPGLQVHQEGRPAAARSAPVRGHLPQEQGRPSRPASRAADRERLLGVLQLPALRLHHEPRAARRPARHRRRPAGAQGRGGDLPHLRLDQRHAARTTIVPGVSATPAARRTPRPSPVRHAPAVAREPVAATKGGGRPRGGARSGGRIDDQTHAPGRAGPRRVSGEPAGQTTDPALARFLRSLAARDASPHTQRAYATAVGAYLDWLARGARTGDARREPTCGPTSASSARAAPARRSRSGWPPSASFHRWATRSDLAPGDPWGAIATPRLPRRLPRVLEVEQVDALLAVVEADLEAVPGDDPEHAALRLALALRDRALVETAYAAGLRISELARPTLGALDLAARRDPGPGQGPQGADRAARPAGARRPSPTTSRTAGRSCSSARPRRRAAAGRDLPEPPRPPARRARPALPASTGCACGPGCRSGSRRTPSATRSRRTCSTAAPTCASSRSCSATRTWRRPRSTRTSRPVDCRPPIGRPTRGPGATRPRDRRPGRSPGPGSSSRARSSSRACSATSASSSSPTFGLLAGELDAFFAAFRLPDLIFQLVAAGALSSALIPIVSALFTTGEQARAWRVVSTVINLMLIGLAVLAVGLFILAPVVVPIDHARVRAGPARQDRSS